MKVKVNYVGDPGKVTGTIKNSPLHKALKGLRKRKYKLLPDYRLRHPDKSTTGPHTPDEVVQIYAFVLVTEAKKATKPPKRKKKR
ncbi:MAG: hypothetical protein CL489_06290 [Acidobacteria bacterium]|nr:hypothetical protein [Acidobacteriota bacterium]|tara:strand:- start:41265 stop:41519 length:255 start_codon:yes stop_codon:yes gene_type:complete